MSGDLAKLLELQRRLISEDRERLGLEDETVEVNLKLFPITIKGNRSTIK